VLIGFAIAAAFVAGLLWFNVANLWYLVTHNSMGPLAVLILWFANGIVFAGVQFAIAVMTLREDDSTGGTVGWLQNSRLQPIPIPVAVEDSRNRLEKP